MALSTLRLTLEEENYWKLSMLNVMVVPDAIRAYFDSLIPPTSLAPTIRHNSMTIDDLIYRKCINKSQLKILQRIPGTIWPPCNSLVTAGPTATSSADFDVSLMVCLLRNIEPQNICSPATGWNDLPHPHDKSPGAHLARLRYYRNALAHSTEKELNTLDFQNRWTAISEAIKFCHSGQSPSRIIEILNSDLDGSRNAAKVALLLNKMVDTKRYLALIEAEKDKAMKELANLQINFDFYKDGHLPKNISENNNDLINQWKIEDATFYTTSSVKMVADWLESKNIVMIIGHSGSGKSAAARNVALKWHAYGYDVVPVECVEKILEYRCKRNKQIFVIDDVIGKYSINESFVHQWEKLDTNLSTLFDDNNAKLIFTSRKAVDIDEQFRISNIVKRGKARIFDLDHLLCDEKISILKKHLIYTNRQKAISDQECRACCDVDFAFPFLCHMFTTNDELFQCKSDFFFEPYSYLYNEIAKLYKQNIEIYCSLVICMIFWGFLNEQLLSVFEESNDVQEKSRIPRIFSMISQSCGLERNMSRQSLLKCFKAVNGEYILYEKRLFGNTYILQDNFLNIISFHFANVDICIFLKCCNINFLCERVRVISPHVNDDPYIIVLPENHFCNLANRFIEELKKGNFEVILSSQPISKREFINVLSQVIDDEDLIAIQLLMKLESTLPDKLHFDPCYTETRNTEAIKVVMKEFPEAITLFHWVIAKDCHNFFAYFWKNMSQNQKRRYLREDQCFFSLALLSGSKQIIIQMLDSGANINSHWSQFSLKELVTSCTYCSDCTDLFKIFIDREIDINFIDYHGKSLFLYAIASENSKIRTLLVEKDSKKNALLEAIFKSNIQQTNDLLGSNDINAASNYGWSVFHFAAYNNDIAMMELIFDTSMKKCRQVDRKTNPNWNDVFVAIDKKDKIGWSPLHLACALKNYEAVDFLVGKKATIHVVDINGRTPLHISCNKKLTSSLLKQRDSLKETYFIKNNKTSNEERLLMLERYQHPEGTKKDSTQTKKTIKNIKYVHTKENSTYNQTLFSLIYVTCMNILFVTFSYVNCRRTIDKPDKNGNTILHDYAKIQRSDDSMACVECILGKGASPGLYNIHGCMPSDVAFYRGSNKVYQFLNKYSMQTAQKEIWISVLISIITFLLVVTFCLASYYVCTGYEDVNYNNNFYHACVNSFADYSNCTLHNCHILNSVQFQVTCQNIVKNNQNLNFHSFLFIRHLSILCILTFQLLWTIKKTILCRQKFHTCESIYILVRLTMLILVMTSCFSGLIKGQLLNVIVYAFTFWVIICMYNKNSTKNKNPFLTIYLFISCMFVLFFIWFYTFGRLLLAMLVIVFSWSTMIHLLSFFLSFIGIYMYINIFPGCIYLIWVKIWETSKRFRQYSPRLPLTILKVLHSPKTTFSNFNKPLFKWHIIFQSILFLIFLIFESIIFRGTYQIDSIRWYMYGQRWLISIVYL